MRLSFCKWQKVHMIRVRRLPLQASLSGQLFYGGLISRAYRVEFIQIPESESEIFWYLGRENEHMNGRCKRFGILRDHRKLLRTQQSVFQPVRDTSRAYRSCGQSKPYLLVRGPCVLSNDDIVFKLAVNHIDVIMRRVLCRQGDDRCE